ncbi:MAG TPA: acyl-ACP--UDP-N-acetylglucosamine O-acyltransferase [Tepidisphaeraceae bacterium]|nr:acyl-ACP--UDP-N-acetylglucosamine O-acyltransferase [Tepidisphaeraceae bacterium]
MPTIHPTAIIDPLAQLASDVQIGPYTVIEGKVEIGAGTTIGAHCVIKGHTVIGEKCRIGPAAYVGLDPQHLGYDGSETSAIIGEGTIIREGASVHRATHGGIEHATRVGKRCFLMGASHVGHDSQIGDDVILANGVLIGGHVIVGERVFFGGGCVVHQFCQIGRCSIIGGNEAVTRDLPPFSAARYDGLKGYNAVGCRRAGINGKAIRAIRQAFACLHTHRTTTDAVAAMKPLADEFKEVREIVDFIAGTKRGIQPSVHFFGHSKHDESDD